MGKYAKATRKIKEEQAFEKEQLALKKKYDMENENVIIKEKSSVLKFLITTGGRIIRIAASIVLYVLAALGLLSLIYPSTRAALTDTLQEIYIELIRLVS